MNIENVSIKDYDKKYLLCEEDGTVITVLSLNGFGSRGVWFLSSTNRDVVVERP